MLTASMLFAGDKHEDGPHRCFMCGAFCNDKIKTKDFIKPTFTNIDIMKYPGSEYVCSSCVYSMQESFDVMTIDGEERTGRSGSPRLYSWIITKDKKTACTKKHLRVLRRCVLSPPAPPFCIVLTESGQKQIIFRGEVAHDRNTFPVILDEQIIYVERKAFKKHLELAMLCSAGIGKRALSSPDTMQNYKSIIGLYGCEGPLVEWIKVYNTPMGVLAAWLCAGKEEALKDERVVNARNEAKDCRTFGTEKDGGGRGGRGERESNQVLLDLTGTLF